MEDDLDVSTPEHVYQLYEDGTLKEALKMPNFTQRLIQTVQHDIVVGKNNEWRFLCNTRRFHLQRHAQRLWGMEAACRDSLPRGTVLEYQGSIQRKNADNGYTFLLDSTHYLNPLQGKLGASIGVLFNDDFKNVVKQKAYWVPLKGCKKNKGKYDTILFLLTENASPGDVCVISYGNDYALPEEYIDETQPDRITIHG